MASLPKPLIGLLLGTVAFFALWMVALKPSSSSSGGGSQGGLGQYQSAINKAHQAVTTSNQANARLGAPTATGPAPTLRTPAKTATAASTATVAKTAPAPKARTGSAAKPAHAAKPTKSAAPVSVSAAAGVKMVQDAVVAHKVVAVLFYNGAAADDQAMEKEIAAVPTHGGKVVKLAVPVSELTQFAMITTQVPVVTAPTLVVIDAARQATTITGYADPVEIGQRIADALGAS
jgi:hypothetical protein